MLPLFPLQIVAYPEERVALHIFEDRYRQLIQDCDHDQLSFGIPTYCNNELTYGTEVSLHQIVKKYSSGEYDVICYGKRVFRIKSFEPQLEGKLYAGGEVEFLENNKITDETLQEELLTLIQSLYKELNVEKTPNYTLPITSYAVAHKIGLSLEDELYLLTVTNEIDRLTFLIDYLEKSLPVVKNMNRAKKLIQLNGHFKNLDPLDFKGFERF